MLNNIYIDMTFKSKATVVSPQDYYSITCQNGRKLPTQYTVYICSIHLFRISIIFDKKETKVQESR